MFVCSVQIITGLDNQSKLQMLTLFLGRHIRVPLWYTNIAAPYWGSVNLCGTFRRSLGQRIHLKLGQVSSLFIFMLLSLPSTVSTDASTAADMKCAFNSSCTGCEQTDPMTVDPGSNITLNCSTSTGKLAQGMTWKQAKQEVQKTTGSSDLVLLQSNSAKDRDNVSCTCTAVYFMRKHFLIFQF